MLDVGDGIRSTGNAAGTLSASPRSSCLYRAVLFDQRGCGRSRPLASEPSLDLAANTTTHLIADIELLRLTLGVDRWTILGLSWGTTLGLAYAQDHLQRVNAMVLGFVTTTSRSEVRWITEDVGRIFPEEWDRFARAVPNHLRHLPLVDAYAILLGDHDPTVRDYAARSWCTDAHVSLTPGMMPSPHFDDPEFRLGFARLVTHYWRHAAFLAEDQLIRDASRLNGIPGVLIHGRYDVSGALVTAWKLHKQWATSRLHILDDAGRGGGRDFMPLVLHALSEFAVL
jgi:proline iminopeptidase